MKLFAVILTIIICVSPACKSESTTDEQIVPGTYPSHVVIKLASTDFCMCEGVLLSKNYVLTSAGCVKKYKSSLKYLEVVAGIISTKDIKSEKNAQIRQVTDIAINPEWFSSKQQSGDVATLKVSPSFDINKYVDISGYGGAFTTNSSVRLVGYGDGEKLIQSKLRATSGKECGFAVANATDSNSSPATFCGKISYDGEYENTFYDRTYAGAPVLSDDADKNVRGVMSVNYNSITNVAHYADWIEAATKV
ncbi:uncharacterized protein LOC135840168 [Planococcus citri]|uniref:uncharacterized protein LOC135840168 n=1 Tax=Planococcus citri TaxID=170843 RepID=UPI0031F86C7C